MKSRLRIYQKTRWCGAILLLMSNKRAYDRGCYENGVACPVDLDTIETYIQILKPAYLTTLGWEKNNTSIADVIPQVLFLIEFWTKMEIKNNEARELCYFLIHFIKIKFEYELGSQVYHVKIYILNFETFSKNNFFFLKVASILRVSALNNWITRSYSTGFLKKGLEALKDVCILFLYSRKSENEKEQALLDDSDNYGSQVSNKTQDNFASMSCYNYSQQSSEASQENEAFIFKRDKELQKEISFLTELLGDKKRIQSYAAKKTAKFWTDFKSEMPNLFELQIILLNCPATSSFIERFFSLSGIVCDIRRLNMTDDLMLMRSLMKANMGILKELNMIHAKKA